MQSGKNLNSNVRTEPYKVLLEVGHGGRNVHWEPGAVWKGVREYDLNWTVAKVTQSIIQAQGYICDISDYEGSLYEIGRQAKGYKVFCSIHHNASTGHNAQGTEAFYHATKGGYFDRTLSLLVGKAISTNLGIRLRDDYDSDGLGDRGRRLGVLSGAEDTDCEACVLVECYFMDFEINHDFWSKKAGIGLANGILEYLAIER